MVITVNGTEYALEKEYSIKEWLLGSGVEPDLTAIEHNGNILQRNMYADVVLKDGDRLEVIRFVGGG